MHTSFIAGHGNARLAVHRMGAGRPVVLLHGLFSSAAVNWVKYGTAQRLVDAGFEAIMPDLRAHGQSDAPHDPAAIDLDHQYEAPSAAHVLGTADNGVDLLSALLHGARAPLAARGPRWVVSVVVALMVVGPGLTVVARPREPSVSGTKFCIGRSTIRRPCSRSSTTAASRGPRCTPWDSSARTRPPPTRLPWWRSSSGAASRCRGW